jgi:aconitate hydratase
MAQGASIEIPNLRQILAGENNQLEININGKTVIANLDVSSRHRQILLAGGLLNWARGN